MATFKPKRWVNPFEKCQFSTFWTSCFYSLERHFIVPECGKIQFPNLFCLKKGLKNAHISTKTMDSPRWKNVNFLTVWTSCCYSLERHLIPPEYRKRHYCNLYCLKQRLEKSPYLGKNRGLKPLEKCQFFDFFKLLFL